MKKLLSLTALAMALLVVTPVMADRRHDYRNYDRGQRYEGGGYRSYGGHGYYNGGRGYYGGHGYHGSSSSNWGVSFGFGYSNYYPAYTPVYSAPVYRSYEPCATYYRPAYDCGESYYPVRSYSYCAPTYTYASVGYSSGNYCGTSRYYGSYYSSYGAPQSYYSVRFYYGR